VTELAAPIGQDAELPLVKTSNRVAAFEPAALVIDYDRFIIEAIHHRLEVMRVEARYVCPQQSFLVVHRLLRSL